ncbi:hypothetical protein Tco_0193028 [Tanacetum coccineum]
MVRCHDSVFVCVCVVDKGDVVSDNHQAGKNTTPPLLVGEPIPDKTDHQLEVEVEDSKVIVAREKKKIQSAKAASKKKEPEKGE